MAENGERELLAQEMTRLAEAIRALDQRVGEVETVNARLELAALTTSRSMQEIQGTGMRVYEAMPVARKPRKRPTGPDPDGDG